MIAARAFLRVRVIMTKATDILQLLKSEAILRIIAEFSFVLRRVIETATTVAIMLRIKLLFNLRVVWFPETPKPLNSGIYFKP